MNTTKKCIFCKMDIDIKAMKCPHCKTDLRSWASRHPVLITIIILIFIPILLSSFSDSSSTPTPVSQADLQKQAKELADWQKTPAGKLCASHPTWKRDDCDGLVDRKVWVGMSYEMLVYLRGRPDDKNVSNYGNHNQYQYCWTSLKPSCFYDDNDDGIIDSYN